MLISGFEVVTRPGITALEALYASHKCVTGLASQKSFSKVYRVLA
jgi:hypothetical protein